MPFGLADIDANEGLSRLALLLAGAKQAGAMPPDGAPQTMDAANAAPPANSSQPAPSAMNLGYKVASLERAPSQPVEAPAATPAPNTSGAIALSKFALPTPPPAPPDQSAARAALTAQRDQYAKPTDPNVVKPRWFDRLFGGMATMGAAMQHNPNAVDIGTGIVNRRYTTAESTREKNLEGVTQKLGDFDSNAQAMQRAFENQNQNFSNKLNINKEQRAEDNEQALAAQRKANAERYESMSPSERAKSVPDLEKSLGRALAPDEKENFILYGKPDKASKAPGKEPMTYEQLVIAAEQEKDPETKAAYNRAAKRIEDAEKKRFNYKQDGGATKEKRGTPGEFEKVESDKQKKYDALEADYKEQRRSAESIKDPTQRQARLNALDQAHVDNKNKIEQNYATSVNTLGGKAQPATFNGGGNPAPAAAAQSEPTVRVRKPDGTVVPVYKSKLPQALKLGGKVVN